MPTLSGEIKRHIVVALAQYDRPTTIVQSVKEVFGVEITRQQVETHDPTKQAGINLAKRWRDLFETTRTAFKQEVAEVPIALKVFRLRALGRAMFEAEKAGNFKAWLGAVELADKITSGYHAHKADQGGNSAGVQIVRVEGLLPNWKSQVNGSAAAADTPAEGVQPSAGLDTAPLSGDV